MQTKVDNETTRFSVFRIDFAARLRMADGSEQLVIIEIQKAKFPTDILRFRKYLGTQYRDLCGKRVDQILAYLEETDDVDTFKRQLTAMMADLPEPQTVETLRSATWYARLMGLFRAQR